MVTTSFKTRQWLDWIRVRVGDLIGVVVYFTGYYMFVLG